MLSADASRFLDPSSEAGFLLLLATALPASKVAVLLTLGGRHRSLPDQQITRAVQHQCRLLLHRLRRHKPHAWSRHSLADRLRISRIRHLVSKPRQFLCPVMRRRTGFNANQATRQGAEKLHDLLLLRRWRSQSSCCLF
jgi:hypothetical protein